MLRKIVGSAAVGSSGAIGSTPSGPTPVSRELLVPKSIA